VIHIRQEMAIHTGEDKQDLIAAAAGGDQAAFVALVEPHRAEVHAHCYRMLGSLQDADDALQVALFRAWRGLARFEGRGSFRGWLYRIATNACLRLIERRPPRLLPVDSGPPAAPHSAPGAAAEPGLWLDPYPDAGLEVAASSELTLPELLYEQRESVELAFVAAVQYLGPRQRAALLLHDVLRFSAREIADMLGTTPASINSALQRARATVSQRQPDASQHRTLAAVGGVQQQEIVQRFIAAWDEHDVAALVAMLSDQATWSMPPLATWYTGRRAIAAFLAEFPMRATWQWLPVRINGQLGVASYMRRGRRRLYRAYALHALTLRGTAIERVTAFLRPDLFGRFHLPDLLPELAQPDAAGLSVRMR
jgi:RNA polymerase sigma-70 factor (ECF subfamily)